MNHKYEHLAVLSPSGLPTFHRSNESAYQQSSPASVADPPSSYPLKQSLPPMVSLWPVGLGTISGLGNNKAARDCLLRNHNSVL